MVVLVVQVDDLVLLRINPKCHPPVLRNRQAPNALAIAHEPVSIPARNRSQLFFSFHVLKERQDSPELWDDRGLNRGGNVILDESSKPPVEHVSNSHGTNYRDDSLTVKRPRPVRQERSDTLRSNDCPSALAVRRAGASPVQHLSAAPGRAATLWARRLPLAHSSSVSRKYRSRAPGGRSATKSRPKRGGRGPVALIAEDPPGAEETHSRRRARVRAR